MTSAQSWTALAERFDWMAPNLAGELRDDPLAARPAVLAPLVVLAAMTGWILTVPGLIPHDVPYLGKAISGGFVVPFSPTESQALALAVLLGCASRIAGFAVVSGYAASQLAVGFNLDSYSEFSEPAVSGEMFVSGRLGWVIGHVVGIALVYVLCVWLPRATLWVADAVGDHLPRWFAASRDRTIASAALIVFLVGWQTAPLVVRGVYLLQGLSPPNNTLLRREHTVYLLLAVVIGLAAADRLEPADDARTRADPVPDRSTKVRVLAIVARSLALTLVFAGIYQDWVDVGAAFALITLANVVGDGLANLPQVRSELVTRNRVWVAIAMPVIAGALFVPSVLTGRTLNRIVFVGFGSALLVTVFLTMSAPRSRDTSGDGRLGEAGGMT